MKHDLFTLEVFRNQVSSVATQMGQALHRTAFSPNIKERKDHSCAVFDPEGRLVAQAEHIPVHLGAMPETVKAVLHGFALDPGDLVVLNDPFLGGTHLPDISMVSPVYLEGRLAALLASRAHHSDVGGSVPGSLGLVSDIHQEGLIIPPVLFKRKGRPVPGVEQVLCANSRNPEERSGDLAAQVAAHAVGEKRLEEIAGRYGTGGLLAGFNDLMDYSEKLTAGVLAGMNEGSYSFRDRLDDDGFSSDPVEISVSITLRDASAVVDFSGTSGPVRGPFNCPRAVTLSACYYVFRCVTGEQIPASEGSFRPLDIRIPEGCLLDARYPHAVGGGNVETSQRVVDVVLGALAGAVPGIIPAASYGTMSNFAAGSSIGSTSGHFSYYETTAGGCGGHPLGRGASATHAHMTNTLNTPIEALEYAYPLRVTLYRVRRGSGGQGLNPGGDGIEREIEFLEGGRLTILSDRRTSGPWGLEGGGSGLPGANTLTSRDGSQKIPSKCHLELCPGDRVMIATPGGGGWGIKERSEAPDRPGHSRKDATGRR